MEDYFVRLAANLDAMALENGVTDPDQQLLDELDAADMMADMMAYDTAE